MKPILTSLFLLFFQCVFCQNNSNFETINPDKILIVRDTFGIPHIFADTDAEVAYGLAWANAEDNFKTIQETHRMGKAMAGETEGKEGAAKDFLNKALRLEELVDEQYNTLSPQFIKYLDGYCQGINAYARKYPHEVENKKLFPVTPKDILKSYAFIACYLSFVHKPIVKIMNGEIDKEETPFGSNAYAVNSAKTIDGNTYLAINPHQPLEGPFSFHEAHLCSKEGLNIIGAHFPGGTSIFMGNNENLGWGLTFNDYDMVDTYQLKMHPQKKLYYEFDGEWKKLEEIKIKLKVKIAGFLKITVRKKAYRSIYGTTIKSKNNKFYSVKCPANETIKFPEQFYYMNKAKTFNEFYSVMQMQGFPRFNCVYADKEGNLFYIDNGRVPKRVNDYNWAGILPGNTSKTLWTELYKLEELPQVQNPSCGYVFNMNNTPFNSTCAGENPDSLNYDKFPLNMGLKYTNSNRSTRFMEQIKEKDKFNFEEFKKIKFDTKFSEDARFLKSINELFELNPKDYPELAESITYLNNWDKNASTNSVGAAYLAVIFDYLFKKHNFGYGNLFTGINVNTAEFVSSVSYTKEYFLKYFNKTDVTLGELQKHVRGNVEYPLPGFSDALAANYIKPYQNGRYVGTVGESYVHFVSFSKNGPEIVETLLPYGNSARKESKHFTDQMELFSKQKTKKVVFSNKIEDIFPESKYNPK
jgi:acyl-homoserine-lactone acylase